ncbi:MAG: hypothetical protein WBF71_06370 [Microthrixaceae bacterium]
MNNVIYLFIVFGLSVIGLSLLWLRNRPASSSPRSSVEQFNEKMKALAPDEAPEQRPRRKSTGAG